MAMIDGKKISAEIRAQIALDAQKLMAETGIRPGLAVVIVGDDPASHVYVKNKKKGCEQVGFYSEEYALPEQTSQEELMQLLDRLNADPKIHGILVQLPLPRHLDEKAVIERILPSKDVDAFHAVNVGKIMIGNYDFLPCTPAGVMELIHSTGISVSGKECVVIGRSNIVGKPMADAFTAGKRHGDDLPFPDKKFGRSDPAGGHSGIGSRPGKVCYHGYGKTRSGCH